MAKIYGLFGSMQGKIADTVMVVRNGEQIVRKYQPMVSNPSTPAQVAQRAKLKLMSQLATIMAPSLGFRRKGNVSARNLFTKANIVNATFLQDNADIDLTSVKLTNGVEFLPSLTVTYADNDLNVELSSLIGDFDRVNYFVFEKIGNELRFVNSQSVERTELLPKAPASFGMADGEFYVYAYGVRYNTAAARTYFGNLVSPSAVDVARIVTTSMLLESDITITETKAAKHTPAN